MSAGSAAPLFYERHNRQHSPAMDNQLLSHSLMLGSTFPVLPHGQAPEQAIKSIQESESLGGFQNLPVSHESFRSQQTIPRNQIGRNADLESQIQADLRRRKVVILSQNAAEHPRDAFAQHESRELESLWLVEHRLAYTGQWVALFGDRLHATGGSAAEVYRTARSAGVSAPFVVFVDAKEELPFAGW